MVGGWWVVGGWMTKKALLKLAECMKVRPKCAGNDPKASLYFLSFFISLYAFCNLSAQAQHYWQLRCWNSNELYPCLQAWTLST